MSHRFYNSEVIDIIDEAPNVKRFFFRITELEKYDFTPGQFAMIELPLHSKISTRAYSIASAPAGTNIIEFIIAHKTGGLATDYLFNEIKTGSKIPMSEPMGKFILKESPGIETELCFICTGTGIAPFRSMLLNLSKKNSSFKNVKLLFGGRHEEDILYRKEMEELEKKMDNFQFVPVLSREDKPEWKGEKGYVHLAYQKIYQDQRPAMFYLCGWKEMIKEASHHLQEMGYDRNHIHFEVYD